jgi:hypothetical protein
MLKTILFTLIAEIAIFNSFSLSMEIEEEEKNKKCLVNKVKFIDRIPQALTCLQTDVVFKQGGLTLDDIVLENGGDVVRTRKFKLICIDYSLDFLEYMNDETIINSTWSESHNAWFYLYLFPAKKSNDKENINTKSISFFVKEIKDETKQKDEKIIIFQDRVKFIEKQPEKLTFLQAKIMFLHGSFSLKTEVQENGVNVIKERKFKPELLDGKIEVLQEENDQTINGFWAGANNAWMFSYSPAPNKGVLFYVKEVF